MERVEGIPLMFVFLPSAVWVALTLGVFMVLRAPSINKPASWVESGALVGMVVFFGILVVFVQPLPLVV